MYENKFVLLAFRSLQLEELYCQSSISNCFYIFSHLSQTPSACSVIYPKSFPYLLWHVKPYIQNTDKHYAVFIFTSFTFSFMPKLIQCGTKHNFIYYNFQFLKVQIQLNIYYISTQAKWPELWVWHPWLASSISFGDFSVAWKCGRTATHQTEMGWWHI